MKIRQEMVSNAHVLQRIFSFKPAEDNNTFVNHKRADFLGELRSPYLFIWKKCLNNPSRNPWKNLFCFHFLKGFCLEAECKFSLMKLNKETEKIRDVTKSLSDVCKVDIYKDFLKLFFLL